MHARGSLPAYTGALREEVAALEKESITWNSECQQPRELSFGPAGACAKEESAHAIDARISYGDDCGVAPRSLSLLVTKSPSRSTKT